MVVPPQPTKMTLRAILKARRQAFVSGLKPVEFERRIQAMMRLALDTVSDARTVALYVAIGAEIDPSLLAEALRRRDVALALPHVSDRVTPMKFLAWNDAQPLVLGPFGLSQPREDAAEIVPDIIFAPLLGFDTALNRVGYGAGFYDRAFARYPAARRIGLAWNVQACDAIPVDAWDVPLHGVVTENEWISP